MSLWPADEMCVSIEPCSVGGGKLFQSLGVLAVKWQGLKVTVEQQKFQLKLTSKPSAVHSSLSFKWKLFACSVIKKPVVVFN